MKNIKLDLPALTEIKNQWGKNCLIGIDEEGDFMSISFGIITSIKKVEDCDDYDWEVETHIDDPSSKQVEDDTYYLVDIAFSGDFEQWCMDNNTNLITDLT